MYSSEMIYRDTLAFLREKSGGKEILNLRETADILGFKDVRTVKKKFPFVDGYITLVTLARCLTPDSAD